MVAEIETREWGLANENIQLCESVPSVHVHMYVYMASTEPMVGKPLLIRQLHLISVSL